APVPGVRRPTHVRLVVDGEPAPGAGGEAAGAGAAVAVSEGEASPVVSLGGDGVVRLPRPLRGRRFRLEIVRAAFPAGTPGIVRQRRAVGIAEIHGDGVPRVDVPRSGALKRDCVLAGTVGGREVSLRADATIEDLDAGRPLRVTGCGALELPAGEARLEMGPGALAPYLLRLRSPGASTAPASPGRVVDSGTATRSGARDGVELDLNGPARLVLAESYNRGRRASCDGDDLGPPEVGDGYGTAWRVPKTCHDVEIRFAPNRLVDAGYALSLIAGALLLGLLLLRKPPPRAPAPPPREPAAARPIPLRRAAVLAILPALALGFIFAARATPLFYAATLLVLTRGIGARPLALAGGAVLTVAVPVLTLLIRPENRGGYNPEYAADRIAVHWVAVAGVTLFAFALSRAMARTGRARAARPSRAAPPARAP
ncbi:MAG TPA: hypothetical protein VFG79_14610, partial [Solirubrobacter sp.]|nr:hypothetical protein [Solirubrobacter sp.]